MRELRRPGAVDQREATAVVRVDDAYLPLRRLAAYAGLSVRTLRAYLTHPSSPLPHYRIGGKILVRRSEFDAWAIRYKVIASVTVDGTVRGVLADLGIR
jgi:lambda repressor-like predicted transcriptional regulator